MIMLSDVCTLLDYNDLRLYDYYDTHLFYINTAP